MCSRTVPAETARMIRLGTRTCVGRQRRPSCRSSRHTAPRCRSCCASLQTSADAGRPRRASVWRTHELTELLHLLGSQTNVSGVRVRMSSRTVSSGRSNSSGIRPAIATRCSDALARSFLMRLFQVVASLTKAVRRSKISGRLPARLERCARDCRSAISAARSSSAVVSEIWTVACCPASPSFPSISRNWAKITISSRSSSGVS